MCVIKLWFIMYFFIIVTGFHIVTFISGVICVSLQSLPHSNHIEEDLSVSGCHNFSRALGILDQGWPKTYHNHQLRLINYNK